MDPENLAGEGDALTDPRCLVTSESLLVDGANGVCRDARLGSREGGAWRASALLAGALLIAAWLRAPRPSRRTRLAVLAVLALGAAAPGAWALCAVRADRPAHASVAAEGPTRLHDAVRAFASRERCAAVRIDRCESCDPVIRLALAEQAARGCEGPAAWIELHEDALGGRCVERRRTLACGTPR